MKKFSRFIGFCFFVLLTSAIPAISSDSLEKAEEKRSVILWVEGKQMGDMVVNARAQMYFCLLDSTMCSLIAKDPSEVSDDMAEAAQFRDRAASQKSQLFLLRYRALKRWDFDPTNIVINGWKVDKKHIYTNYALAAIGEIPPSIQSAIALGVPFNLFKEKKTLVFEYAGAKVEWKIPQEVK